MLKPLASSSGNLFACRYTPHRSRHKNVPSLIACSLSYFFQTNRLTSESDPFSTSEKLIPSPAEHEYLKRFGKQQLTTQSRLSSVLTQLGKIDKIAVDIARQLFERLSKALLGCLSNGWVHRCLKSLAILSTLKTLRRIFSNLKHH